MILRVMHHGCVISVVLMAWLGCVVASVRLPDIPMTTTLMSPDARAVASHALRLGFRLPRSAVIIGVLPEECERLGAELPVSVLRYLSPRIVRILYGALPVDPERVELPAEWRGRGTFLLVPTEMGPQLESPRLVERARFGRVVAFQLQ